MFLKVCMHRSLRALLKSAVVGVIMGPKGLGFGPVLLDVHALPKQPGLMQRGLPVVPSSYPLSPLPPVLFSLEIVC